MFGEIAEVAGEVRTDVAERPDAQRALHRSTAEDGFAARLRFASGATALVDTAFATPASLPPRVRIFGADGLIEAIGSTENHVRGSREDRTITFPPFDGDPHLPAIRPWAATMRAAITERRQIAPSFEDGLACAEVMDRLRATAL